MPVVDAPRIDPRDFKKLLADRISIAPFYTPDWNVTDEKDMGFALLKIFTHIQEEIINRLNRVPDKNFTAFLEMLGIKLMPAQPAKVPVTFYLSKGLSGGVYAPARTQIATEETEKHEALVFETTNSFFAASAAIKDVYCADPGEDKIFSNSDDLNKKEFKLFEEKKDLQEHVLYLGHDDLFKLKGEAKISLDFTFVSGTVTDLKKLTWEYWGDDKENPEIFDVSIKDSQLILTSKGEIKEKKIHGVKSYWIHCKNKHVTEKSRLPVISNIQIMNVAPEGDITPDVGFYNFIPLDLSTKFNPFGEQPALFDTFYIASREAFSKKHATIEIDFMVEDGAIADEVTHSWEYWDGTVWRTIHLEENYKKIDFTSSDNIKFECPNDLEETEVNGEKNYWIRVRLVNGNYGQYKFEEDIKNNFWKITPKFNPPIITKFLIKYYFTEGIYVQHYLARNNREYRNFKKEIKEGTGFMPFVPLAEKKPTIYLGFSDTFNKGNISIFFSILEKIYPQAARPKIQWTYWSKAHNVAEIINSTKIKLVSLEGISIGTELFFEESSDTEIITETAIVKSYAGTEITLERKLYHKYTKSVKVYKRTFLEVNDYTEYLTKSGTLEFIGPDDQSKTHKFGKESYWLMGTLSISTKLYESPFIKGIHPNTVWSEQVETIEDEILGSSDGDKNKSFEFIKSPVISPEIWVMEGKIILQDEKEEKEILPEEDVQEVKDDSGKIKETWVRWKAVEDFINSTQKSRHYITDNSQGMVQFGDGKNGMIPPRGQDNIRTNYKSGGGVVGNVLKNEITVLKTPIAGIDHVINHEPAEGGSDTELLEEALERGPHLIKHRGRAVTIEDFERLARAASSYIARTKCITEGGKVKVIIIPKGKEDKPQPSIGLVQIVEDYLRQLSLNSILSESLDVSGPLYKEVKVSVDVIPESIDQAIPLEKDIRKQLKAYLHPLTGGNEKRGWEFGRGVHISDVYTLLEGIKDVDHVENLKLNDDRDVYIGESQTVCSGEHKITMKLGS